MSGTGLQWVPPPKCCSFLTCSWYMVGGEFRIYHFVGARDTETTLNIALPTSSSRSQENWNGMLFWSCRTSQSSSQHAWLYKLGSVWSFWHGSRKGMMNCGPCFFCSRKNSVIKLNQTRRKLPQRKVSGDGRMNTKLTYFPTSIASLLFEYFKGYIECQRNEFHTYAFASCRDLEFLS